MYKLATQKIVFSKEQRRGNVVSSQLQGSKVLADLRRFYARYATTEDVLSQTFRLVRWLIAEMTGKRCHAETGVNRLVR